MIGVNEIKRTAAKVGIMDPTIIERDYFLSWILKGIYEDNRLSRSLLFKGGTSIKKAYFNDFRFSIDLDFTAKTPVKGLRRKFEEVSESISIASGMVLKGEIKSDTDSDFTEVTIPFTRIVHPQGAPINIYIHLNFREKIVFPEVSTILFYPYSDKEDYGIINARIYSLKEMALEKIRALYFQRHFSISKDLFDIWWLIEKKNIELTKILPYLGEKCEIKGINRKSLSLNPREEFKRDFERNLQQLLPHSLNVEFEEIWATGTWIYKILQKEVDT